MMTEQPKEYIITEDQLNEHRKLAYDVGCEGAHFERHYEQIAEDALSRLENEIRSRPVSIPPEGAAPDYEHCGNMSSDGEHDCNYRGGHCNFAHTRHCKDFIPCTCEYCDGTVHDAAIRQEAREEVLPLVDAAQKTQAELFHACWDKNLIDCVKQLGSDLRAIERSLRHPEKKGVPE